MAVAQTVTRVRVGSGAWAERLVCHPRLPLVVDTVTTATATDPGWLRLRAAVNNALAQRE
jgi:hypothetical protein